MEIPVVENVLKLNDEVARGLVRPGDQYFTEE